MKALALILALALCGCETVENPDGTTTTRFDAAAANSAVQTGFNAYDRYRYQQQYQQPTAYPVQSQAYPYQQPQYYRPY